MRSPLAPRPSGDGCADGGPSPRPVTAVSHPTPSAHPPPAARGSRGRWGTLAGSLAMLEPPCAVRRGAAATLPPPLKASSSEGASTRRNTPRSRNTAAARPARRGRGPPLRRRPPPGAASPPHRPRVPSGRAQGRLPTRGRRTAGFHHGRFSRRAPHAPPCGLRYLGGRTSQARARLPCLPGLSHGLLLRNHGLLARDHPLEDPPCPRTLTQVAPPARGTAPAPRWRALVQPLRASS